MTVPPDPIVLNAALIQKLQANGALRTPSIMAAFHAVPRHLFLPGFDLEKVYSDEAIMTKHRADGELRSSSSQPAMMAIMLEQLALAPGQRVLEIGAGTGYNAALMAQLVGGTGQVVTIDIDEDIVAEARERLQQAGYAQVKVVCADGALGHVADAPYDRIILTVGADDIAPAWLAQLKDNGRLVLPLALGAYGFGQPAIAFQKIEDHLESLSLKPAGFLPLRGLQAPTFRQGIALPTLPGVGITLDDGASIDVEAVARLLRGRQRDLSSDLQVRAEELWPPLDLWLSGANRKSCAVSAGSEGLQHGVVPFLHGLAGQWLRTLGWIEDTTRCALLMRPPGEMPPHERRAQGEESQPFTLFVRSFGVDDRLAEQLIQRLHDWDAAGRPALEKLHIKAFPLEHTYASDTTELVLRKRSARLVLHWIN